MVKVPQEMLLATAEVLLVVPSVMLLLSLVRSPAGLSCCPALESQGPALLRCPLSKCWCCPPPCRDQQSCSAY